jgi:hypothetical protein
MPDILLTHGYFLFEDEKELQVMKPYPTLGLLYLSSYLRRAGFDVDVFDTTFSARGDLFARFAAEPGGVVGIYTNLRPCSTGRTASERFWGHFDHAMKAPARTRGNPMPLRLSFAKSSFFLASG